METCNVGDCFGALWIQPNGTPGQGRARSSNEFRVELALGPGVSRWNPANYPLRGDPERRQPIYPTVFNPVKDILGEPAPLPFVGSKRLTTFSIRDSEAGLARSYVFDTADPSSPVREFDRFPL